MARRTKKTATSAKAARRRSRKLKSSIQARKKKEFTYRGYTLEELKAMPVEEVIGLMTSRVRRSYRRGFNPEEQAFLDRVRKSKGVIKTHRREMVILPEFVGKTLAVYNGKTFREFEVVPEMIGHYIGEFSPTRGFVKHSGPGVGATKSSKFMPLK